MVTTYKPTAEGWSLQVLTISIKRNKNYALDRIESSDISSGY